MSKRTFYYSLFLPFVIATQALRAEEAKPAVPLIESAKKAQIRNLESYKLALVTNSGMDEHDYKYIDTKESRLTVTVSDKDKITLSDSSSDDVITVEITGEKTATVINTNAKNSFLNWTASAAVDRDSFYFLLKNRKYVDTSPIAVEARTKYFDKEFSTFRMFVKMVNDFASDEEFVAQTKTDSDLIAMRFAFDNKRYASSSGGVPVTTFTRSYLFFWSGPAHNLLFSAETMYLSKPKAAPSDLGTEK